MCGHVNINCRRGHKVGRGNTTARSIRHNPAGAEQAREEEEKRQKRMREKEAWERKKKEEMNEGKEKAKAEKEKMERERMEREREMERKNRVRPRMGAGPGYGHQGAFEPRRQPPYPHNQNEYETASVYGPEQSDSRARVSFPPPRHQPPYNQPRYQLEAFETASVFGEVRGGADPHISFPPSGSRLPPAAPSTMRTAAPSWAPQVPASHSRRTRLEERSPPRAYGPQLDPNAGLQPRRSQDIRLGQPGFDHITVQQSKSRAPPSSNVTGQSHARPFQSMQPPPRSNPPPPPPRALSKKRTASMSASSQPPTVSLRRPEKRGAFSQRSRAPRAPQEQMSAPWAAFVGGVKEYDAAAAARQEEAHAKARRERVRQFGGEEADKPRFNETQKRVEIRDGVRTVTSVQRGPINPAPTAR